MQFRKLFSRKKFVTIQYYSNYFYSVNSRSWKILFFGSDEFSLEHLTKLNEAKLFKESNLISSLEVITKCNETKLNPVHKYSLTASLPVHKWPCTIAKNEFDLGIVASFGHLIPQHMIEAFPWGIINVHASLLPRWRGATPIAHAILHGDHETGISIMKIEPHEFDVGKILAIKPWPIEDNIKTKQLTLQLAKCGGNLLLKCLQNLPSYMENSYIQSSIGVTKAPKLKEKMAEINWTSDHLTIYRQFRAIDETFNLFTYWKNNLVKLLHMVPPNEVYSLKLDYLLEKLNDQTSNLKDPGQVYVHKKRNIICIRCKDNWVGFKFIKPNGKRPLTAQEFYSGFLSKVPHEERIFKNILQ